MLDTCLTEDEMTLNCLNIVPGHVQKSAFTLPRRRGVEKEQEKVEDHRVLQTKVHHNSLLLIICCNVERYFFLKVF